VGQLYKRYMKRDDVLTLHELLDLEDKTRCSHEENWMLKYCLPIPVKFTGVWDTVGALADAPGYLSWITGGKHGFLDTNLRRTQEFAFHALAIDEHRKVFAPTLFTHYIPKDPSTPCAPPRLFLQVEQRWFIGSHGNVGGGVEDDALAQIPLKWIMEKAAQQGFTFRRDIGFDADANMYPIEDSFAQFLHGAYKVAHLNEPFYREIARAPEERSSTVVHTINESIDASVFDRWRRDDSYRPPNLAQWAQAKGARIEELHSSVNAKDPNETIPDANHDAGV
jgi:T6SS, Phospholipase effector Tle1-like, catalytic domain